MTTEWCRVEVVNDSMCVCLGDDQLKVWWFCMMKEVFVSVQYAFQQEKLVMDEQDLPCQFGVLRQHVF